jgi:hypothetical protein
MNEFNKSEQAIIDKGGENYSAYLKSNDFKDLIGAPKQVDISKTETTTYKHTTYKVLDSLDDVPLDTRISMSEWLPPFGAEVTFIHNGDFDRGHLHCIAKEGIIIKWKTLDCIFKLDGHWMRIV